MVKTRKAGDLKRKASTSSSEDPESLSPLAEAVRSVSPFVSITPTPPPSRGGLNGGLCPSPRKRILVEDRLEVRPVPKARPVASTSKLVQHNHHQPVASTSKGPAI